MLLSMKNFSDHGNFSVQPPPPSTAYRTTTKPQSMAQQTFHDLASAQSRKHIPCPPANPLTILLDAPSRAPPHGGQSLSVPIEQADSLVGSHQLFLSLKTTKYVVQSTHFCLSPQDPKVKDLVFLYHWCHCTAQRPTWGRPSVSVCIW